ncbi:N-6 DNA methylase [Rhodobacter maris]|uniref:site-specific DNA-methyltransferase (adenine-specific) n=1 Tax=Rhodobacter maris TaxID=446682 RepID=A0A285TIJ0_9RHOB|nr:N-6 DNA methylase [Rhodobacter maris]SOC22091.1 N-6 DNA methylase [Rhodobacter maris]
MSSPARPTTKDLGAYYTPETMADILADWVVQSGRETLLEPSIGDGALLRAAKACADRKFGCSASLKFVGCDLDNLAVARVRRWLAPEHLLVCRDFLEIDPDYVGSADGVICNPPFTRNHALPKARREELRRRFGIKGAAGLWVPFVLHAVRFLAPGGRLAVVVPGAAIFSSYGRDALERVCREFAHVEIRQTVDRPSWSSNAEERGVIVLAHGCKLGSSPIPEATRWSAAGERVTDIHPANPSCFQDALAAAVPLGEIAKLAIGAVTGFNKAFLLSDEERSTAGIDPRDLTPVAARARHVAGLRISSAELKAIAAKGEKTWLLTPQDISKARPGVRLRLATIPIDKRRNVAWLNKRSPWWRVDIGRGCDAIFTYMNDRGPRLVLATDCVYSTNTLHQVCFAPNITLQDRMVASLSMISSFGQLAAERIGRAYGGGVLKFELTDARRFPILTAARYCTKADFESADKAIRSGDFEQARAVADRLLLPAVFGSAWELAAEEMMKEALKMRSARRGGAQG